MRPQFCQEKTSIQDLRVETSKGKAGSSSTLALHRSKQARVPASLRADPVKILLCVPKITGVEQKAALQGKCTTSVLGRTGDFFRQQGFQQLASQVGFLPSKKVEN